MLFLTLQVFLLLCVKYIYIALLKRGFEYMRKRSNVINSSSTIRSRQNSNLFRLRDVHLTKIARAKLHIQLENTFM